MGMKASEVGNWLRQIAGKRDHHELMPEDSSTGFPSCAIFSNIGRLEISPEGIQQLLGRGGLFFVQVTGVTMNYEFFASPQPVFILTEPGVGYRFAPPAAPPAPESSPGQITT